MDTKTFDALYADGIRDHAVAIQEFCKLHNLNLMLFVAKPTTKEEDEVQTYVTTWIENIEWENYADFGIVAATAKKIGLI